MRASFRFRFRHRFRANEVRHSAPTVFDMEREPSRACTGYC